MLASCYLAAGMVGVALYVFLLHRVLRRSGVLARFDPASLRLPLRRLLSYSLPLTSSDLFLAAKTTIVVVLLEHFHGAGKVADLRAVAPLAGLCLVVLQSLKLLYTPLASRLFARGDHAALDDIYWKSAVWITVLSFPVFAACVFLAQPITVLLFGRSYESAGVLLAILAAGSYFNAALGMNTATLEVYARVRLVTAINGLAAAIALGLSLWLIPAHGALGAALATSGALVAYNLLQHAGLQSTTGVNLFQPRYLRVYATVLAASGGLWVLSAGLRAPPALTAAAIAAASLALVRVNREVLGLADTFPELRRVPVLAWLLGIRPG